VNIDIIIANIVVGFAAFIQTTTGVGFAMIAVPLLVLIDLSYAPGPALFVMLFLAVAMVAGSWRDVDRQGFWALIPGLLVGTLVGSRLLGMLSSETFGLVFGLIVLAGLALGQIGFAPKRSVPIDASGGFLSGTMGTISGIHGPPLVVLHQRSTPAVARATIAFVFVIASVLSLISLNAAGYFGRDEAIAGLALLPGLTIGFVVASTGRRFISEAVARNAMLAIAAISAVILIARSVL
jgi:uncharacterized membrane protein YfcA